ncbi:sugar porter family MFS transporter [Xanthobacter sp. TB0139]|uniref:sugar porter family MFS transporter n=1 Tax=Xanthobacter sp. TB0139 TaxID=3459178 RepID=UPI0040395FF3
MIYIVAAVAGIAGFLFGFDEGIIAGALHLLRAQFPISPLHEGLMTSAVPLGALFGALVAGSAVERYGRRTMLLFAALLFAAGALLSSATIAIWMLSLARLILGFAVGIAALVAPLYISESAPPKKRGMLVSIYQLAITLGILGAYLAGYGFSDSWRTMFLLGVVPGVALFASMWLMPETPRWLAAQGRTGQAQAVLSRLRAAPPQSPIIQTEMAEITRTATSDAPRGKWADLFGPVARPALIVGIGLFFLQQLSGINAVIYYAPEIFREAGFDTGSSRLLASVGIGLVNVLMTLVGMALIDRIGRCKLLLIGFTGTALSLGMIAIGAATEAQSLDMVALVGLVIYIGAFAASLGPLPWVMMSEIFPQNVRGLGMSAATLANWGFNFLVVFSFPVLIAHIGLGGIFTIYAMACLAGILFTLRTVPETSGIPLEEIESHLKSGRPFRELGSPA